MKLNVKHYWSKTVTVNRWSNSESLIITTLIGSIFIIPAVFIVLVAFLGAFDTVKQLLVASLFCVPGAVFLFIIIQDIRQIIEDSRNRKSEKNNTNEN